MTRPELKLQSQRLSGHQLTSLSSEMVKGAEVLR
jgi:hypothetical protein